MKRVKIAVMVPAENVDEVRDAMCKAGCGRIGNYTYCTMATPFTGTFIPGEDANPYIGSSNVLEIHDEIKLEAVCDIEDATAVLAAIREVHPYEEPGIDIYPLIDEEELPH